MTAIFEVISVREVLEYNPKRTKIIRLPRTVENARETALRAPCRRLFTRRPVFSCGLCGAGPASCSTSCEIFCAWASAARTQGRLSTTMFNAIDIPYLICSVLSFVPAIVFHEVSHGFAAYRLGDPTAKSQGRLSLNPLKHIDPFGTVIMPALLMLMGMPVFGYAKPVPYNPRYFKDPRKGDLIVGLAGPAANLVMAIVAAIVAWALSSVSYGLAVQNELFMYFYYLFLPMFGLINLFLMFFNLLPIPPLDGSSIFAFILPAKYLPKYYRIQQYALPIFMIVVILVPYVLHVNPIGVYLDATAYNLAGLLFPPGLI